MRLTYSESPSFYQRAEFFLTNESAEAEDSPLGLFAAGTTTRTRADQETDIIRLLTVLKIEPEQST